ncbi:MAG: tetratricopeptide repeat protein, partial [Gemmataceae bacterium]|nr:tetratricopeptide repeat protein [Gemmataceae bacterium]
YAATADEVRAFLDVAPRDRLPATLGGLVARLEAIPTTQKTLLAGALAKSAESHRAAGRVEQAKRDCDIALSLDPGCAGARLCRSHFLEPEPALAELDRAAGRGPFRRDVLVRRAQLALGAKDFRKARGDAERVLDVRPADADARELLARALLGLGEDVKAAVALGDAVRADSTRLKAVAAVMLDHARTLEDKFPDRPGAAASWLLLALAAAEKGTADPKAREPLTAVREAGTKARTDAERLTVLRTGIQALRDKK